MYSFTANKTHLCKFAALLLALSVFVCAAVFVCIPTGVAFAVLPESYVQDVEANG